MQQNANEVITATSDSVFGARLRQAREASKLTQDSLAESMQNRGFDFTQATIYKIESGKRKVSVGEALALAAIVNSDISALTAAADQDLAVKRQNMRFVARELVSLVMSADTISDDIGGTLSGLQLEIDEFESKFGESGTLDFNGTEARPRDYFLPLIAAAGLHESSGFLLAGKRVERDADLAIVEYLGLMNTFDN